VNNFNARFVGVAVGGKFGPNTKEKRPVFGGAL